MKLILASQSARRREILSFFSLPFEQITPKFDEEAHPFLGNPITYACELAEEKASSVASHYPDKLILTADTVVFCNGKLYNKPKDTSENISMLKDLEGKWHHVITAVTAQKNTLKKTEYAETKVLFNALSINEIENYVRALKPQDKAGGYAIQGAGGLIVRRIDGCFYNVMGLPLTSLASALKFHGINLWEHLK